MVIPHLYENAPSLYPSTFIVETSGCGGIIPSPLDEGERDGGDSCLKKIDLIMENFDV